MTNLRAEALREIAREKDRIFRRKRSGLSTLEKAAQEWEGNRMSQEKRTQIEQQENDKESLFKSLSPEEVLKHQKQSVTDGLDWVQYKALEREKKEEQPISLNMATIRSMAKKLIAREWRRAKGLPQHDYRADNLEREAASWTGKKELEQRIQREKEERIMKYVIKLNSALNEFSRKLVDDIGEVADVFNNILEDEVGEIFKIDWSQEGCKVWFEPWEEKKQRRIRGESFPSMFEAVIDGNMDISSFEEVKSAEVKSVIIEEALVQNLEDSIEIGDLNETELEEALEDTLSDFGRLVSLKRIQKGWTATVEPWEEVRRRNIERMGPDPYKYTIVNIGLSDDNLSFSVVR
ncbi:hypothetical protein KJ656_17475 [bacterium]|nr:hypothetical protein [bacterium]